MNLSHVFKVLIPIDVKNVRRDNGISWMIFLPILSALIVRWGVPALSQSLAANNAFDLLPYYPAILAYFFVILAPITFALMIGFMLLDEKDDNTLIALQVTPLSLNAYLAYRVAVPVVLTLLLVPMLFPLSNFSSLQWDAILITTIAAAPMSPMFALYLASIAQNKVQGFALMKLSGFILFIPIFAFFVDSNWQLLFGLIPTYWPMKVYWLLEAGQGPIWPYLLIAILYQSVVAWIFVKRFNRILHQ